MSLSDLARGPYMVTWDTYSFGEHDGVEPQEHYKRTGIKVGSIGDVDIDEYLELIGGMVMLKAREVPLALYQKISPWWSSGPIAMGPSAPNTRLYQYARPLNLHPREMGGTLTKDLNYLKAVPLFTPLDRDGIKVDQQLIGFRCFLDQSQLPNRILGYIGTAP